jgi:hypothetical protein
VLCNLDDVLSVSGHPLSTLQGLQSVFKLEGNKIEEPSMYLGAQFGRIKIEGTLCCGSSTSEQNNDHRHDLTVIKF